MATFKEIFLWYRNEVIGSTYHRFNQYTKQQENRNARNQDRPQPHPDLYKPNWFTRFLIKTITLPFWLLYQNISEFYYKVMYSFPEDKSWIPFVMRRHGGATLPLNRDHWDRKFWGGIGSFLGIVVAGFIHLVKRKETNAIYLTKTAIAERLLEVEDNMSGNDDVSCMLYTPEMRDYIYSQENNECLSALLEFVQQQFNTEQNYENRVAYSEALGTISRHNLFRDPVTSNLIARLDCAEILFLGNYLNARDSFPSTEELSNIVKIIGLLMPDHQLLRNRERLSTALSYLQQNEAIDGIAISLQVINWLDARPDRNIQRKARYFKQVFEFAFHIKEIHADIDLPALLRLLSADSTLNIFINNENEVYIARERNSEPVAFAEEFIDLCPIFCSLMKYHPYIQKAEYHEIFRILVTANLSDHEYPQLVKLFDYAVPFGDVTALRAGMTAEQFQVLWTHSALDQRKQLMEYLNVLFTAGKLHGWLAEISPTQWNSLCKLLELGVSPKMIDEYRQASAWSDEEIDSRSARLTATQQQAMVEFLQKAPEKEAEGQIYCLYLMARLDGRERKAVQAPKQNQADGSEPGSDLGGESGEEEEKPAEAEAEAKAAQPDEEIQANPVELAMLKVREQIAIKRARIGDQTQVIELKQAAIDTNKQEMSVIAQQIVRITTEQSRIYSQNAARAAGEMDGEREEEAAVGVGPKSLGQLKADQRDAEQNIDRLVAQNIELTDQISAARDVISQCQAALERIHQIEQRIIQYQEDIGAGMAHPVLRDPPRPPLGEFPFSDNFVQREMWAKLWMERGRSPSEAEEKLREMHQDMKGSPPPPPEPGYM